MKGRLRRFARNDENAKTFEYQMMTRFLSITFFVLAGLALPSVALAYIGPGAGFAFIGSSFVFILTLGLALVTLLIWPFLWTLRRIRRRGLTFRAKRVVVVGLDGLDAKLTERLMEEGKLPELKKLSEDGGYRRLRTSLPALSPVAWSTFQTGVNPGAHNIFDFLSRDKRLYIPTLTSTETIPGKIRSILGMKLFSKAPKVQITRKSQPFWKILSKFGIFSNILRVPISYPPEKFSGAILSAMCTPDIRGTQGTFSFFSTRPKTEAKVTGGEIYELKKSGEYFEGKLVGPEVTDKQPPLLIPFKVKQDSESTATLIIQGSAVELEKDKLSDWVEVEFNGGRKKKISAIARFSLRETGDQLSLYVTPLNCDPEKPSLPIAHPIYFSSYLAKRIGKFSTLGFAEDTWGRNEQALNDELFLQQAYLTHSERESMFFDALKKTREGVVACVFDATDRVQHMFWRYLEDDHPSPVEDRERFGKSIEELYMNMDEMVGRIREKLNENDVLVVLSDHGFSSFRRGINLNNWLKENGYLVLKEGKTGETDYLRDVDWDKTQAYCLGLTGIYLNRRGREAHGIVSAEEAAALKAELAEKLCEIRDPQNPDAVCVRAVYDAEKVYRGVYAKEAPDLIMGYEPGYRVSWESVTGAMEPEVFTDNIKAWSGDHHIDPELVPGVLFVNRKVDKDSPHLTDLAPSILDTFGVKPPKYMEGNIIF